MLAAAGSPLVAGGLGAPARLVRLRVLRPFLMKGGRRVEIGAEVEVPAALAGELVTALKAQRIVAAPAAAAMPAPAPADQSPAKRKRRDEAT